MNAWFRRLALPALPFFPRVAAGPRSPERRRPSWVAQGRPPAPVRADPAELEERRSAALRQLFPKLASWRARRGDWSRALEIHAYLEGATGLADLEQRIRAVEQRRNLTP